MNLILLDPHDMVPGTPRAVLTGRRHAHVRDILRAAVGDRLSVGMENGLMGEGVVVRLDEREIEMELMCDRQPPPKVPVILAMALMRPIVLRRVIPAAVSLGVEQLHFFHCERVEKSFWQSTSLRPEALRELVILGLEQAKDSVLPPVFFHPRFKPFVEAVVPGFLNGRQGVVADPAGASQVPSVPGPRVLIMGPEGGFIPYELDRFRQAGCSLVGLGPRILRVETALPFFISRFAYL